MPVYISKKTQKFTENIGLTVFSGGVKVCPPAHNYEHEAGSYGDGFT